MFKAVLFGLFTSVLLLPVFGLVISQFLPPDFVAIGAPGWRQQHDQLVSVNAVQLLTVLGWTVAACLGGFVGTRTSPTRTVRAAAWVGALILLFWGIPVGIIAGSNVGWVHLTSCVLIMPSVMLGAALAKKVTGQSAQVS